MRIPLARAALLGGLAASCGPVVDAAPAAQPPAIAAVSGDDYIAGNLLFTAFHEAGHLLISEFDLPVLGREEDAVDNLATLLLLPEEKDKDGEKLILAAAQGWFDSAAEGADAEPAWWDEHGIDQQRGFQILCLLAGADAAGFSPAARAAVMPPERIEGCAGEYDAVSASWDKVLAPHVLNDGEAVTAKIAVRYDPAPKALEDAAAVLRESEILEGLADTLQAGFRLKSAVTLKGSACGEPNAFWDSERRELVMCYELADWYLQRAPG
jgi:hypothetical protein